MVDLYQLSCYYNPPHCPVVHPAAGFPQTVPTDCSKLDSGDPVSHTETGCVDCIETGRVDCAETGHKDRTETGPEDRTVTSHKGYKGGDPDLNAYMMQNMETYLALTVVCYAYSQCGYWNLPS